MEKVSIPDSDAQRSVSPLRVRNTGDEVSFKIKGVVLIEKGFSSDVEKNEYVPRVAAGGHGETCVLTPFSCCLLLLLPAYGKNQRPSPLVKIEKLDFSEF